MEEREDPLKIKALRERNEQEKDIYKERKKRERARAPELPNRRRRRMRWGGLEFQARNATSLLETFAKMR